MTDIILPAHEAKNLADFLRRKGIGEHHPLIRLLDPNPMSLRDEVAEALFNEWCGHRQFEHGTDEEEDHASHGCVLIHADPRSVADAVIAVVRRHIEGLPITCPNVGSGWMDRDTVLRLLGGESDG